MDRNEKGYITLLLAVLITFGFLLSGGVMALLQQPPAGATKYILKDTNPLFPQHKTLQLSTLDFVPAPSLCDPGSNYGDEASILFAFQPACDDHVSAGDVIKVWYTDEHALTLGISPGVSPFEANMTIDNPQVGDKTIKDALGFTYYPGMYLTDVTYDSTSVAGDAQHGGVGMPPIKIYGTWKALNELDPAPNSSLPAGADQISSILTKFLSLNRGGKKGIEAYEAELLWNVNDLHLIPGHTYRAQFVIHDGDQSGGDIGLGCITIIMDE